MVDTWDCLCRCGDFESAHTPDGCTCCDCRQFRHDDKNCCRGDDD